MLTRSSHDPSPSRDQGVSSVVAGILLVAIAIAIAGLIVVWLQGFTGFGSSPPAADVTVLSCQVHVDAVTAELSSGKSLPAEDLTARLVNISSGVEEAEADPLSTTPMMWEARARLTIGDHETDEPNWDDPLASEGGLAADTRYEIAWVHGPSRTVFARDTFTCGPADAPDPRFVLASCRPQNDEVTVRLASDQALDRSRWKATLVNRSDDATEATADPIDEAGIWRPGSALTFHEGTRSQGVSWDADLNRSLEAGGSYHMDFTHLPSGDRRARLAFTC